MNLSERLAEARKRRGKTQAEIAVILGVSPGTVGSWESNDHRFRLDKLDAIAAAYGVKPKTLLDWYVESSTTHKTS